MNSNILQTQRLIKLIKDTFEKELSKILHLDRVSAPLLVFKKSGINDYLNDEYKPISFFAKGISEEIEIVQSLAKWKRFALDKYDVNIGSGIYTDMNALRPGDETDYCHSIYVDQWDWEIKINNEDRNLNFLFSVVNKIYLAFINTYKKLMKTTHNNFYKRIINKEIFFISSQDLYNMFPTLTPTERENEIAKIHKYVFIYQIGYPLLNNIVHSQRAFDYDDWNLNGDLIFYHDELEQALEISSMGIRVNHEELVKQAQFMKKEINYEKDYYLTMSKNMLSSSVGGGIGQSRLCMYLLRKKHIAEVQASLWSDDEIIKMKENNIVKL